MRGEREAAGGRAAAGRSGRKSPAKRAVARQLAAAMRRRRVTKSELARRMRTSRSSLDRLLDPANPALTLSTLERAARALDLRVRVVLE